MLLIVISVIVESRKGTIINHSDRSPLSGIYRCLETTNVTVLVDVTSPYLNEVSNNLLDHLRNQCTSVFVYFHKSQKFVQWSDNLHTAFESEIPKRTSLIKRKVEIIEDLQKLYQYGTFSKQVLIFLQNEENFHMTIMRKLGMLHGEPNWSVIIVCEPYYCPSTNLTYPRIPFHRVFPSSFQNTDLNHIRNHVSSLIENPDFNRFEFLKQIQFEDERLKCLKGKTIHVLTSSWIMSNKLVEDIELLLQQTKRINTKVVFVSNIIDSNFWNFFFKQNRILNSEEFTMAIGEHSFAREIRDYVRDPNGIYMIETELERKKDLFCGRLRLSHKNTVFYVGPGATDISIKEYSEECSDELGKISIKKQNIEDIWLEDVLSLACF